jgi:hypothetical protein
MKLLSDDQNQKHGPGLTPSQLHNNAPPQYNPYTPQQGIEKANNVLNMADHVKGYIVGLITITVAVAIFYNDTGNNFDQINGKIQVLEKQVKKYDELEDDIDALSNSIRSLRYELEQLRGKLETNRAQPEPTTKNLLFRSDSDLYGEDQKVVRLHRNSVIFLSSEVKRT